MKTAFLIVLCAAGIVATAVGVNMLLERNQGVPEERISRAERYLREHGTPFSLHECQVPLSEDPLTVHCYGSPADGGRERYLRIDFTADDTVSGVCVVGTRGCS